MVNNPSFNIINRNLVILLTDKQTLLESTQWVQSIVFISARSACGVISTIKVTLFYLLFAGSVWICLDSCCRSQATRQLLFVNLVVSCLFWPKNFFRSLFIWFLWLKKGERYHFSDNKFCWPRKYEFFHVLRQSPINSQDRISPYNINTTSSRQMTRMTKNII